MQLWKVILHCKLFVGFVVVWLVYCVMVFAMWWLSIVKANELSVTVCLMCSFICRSVCGHWWIYCILLTTIEGKLEKTHFTWELIGQMSRLIVLQQCCLFWIPLTLRNYLLVMYVFVCLAIETTQFVVSVVHFSKSCVSLLVNKTWSSPYRVCFTTK